MLPSSSLELPDCQRGLTAAANAAAAWVRAQRASRNGAAARDRPAFVSSVALDDETLPEDQQYPVDHGGFASAVERAGAWLHALPARAWLTSAAVVGVIMVSAALVAMRGSVVAYWKKALEVPQIERSAGAAAPLVAPVVKTTGRLQISSEPPAARVLVDGTFRGMTPLTLDDLALGRHAIVLESPEGSVSRTVTITASEPVVVEERIFSGWIAVYSPFDLIVREGNTAYTFDDRHQTMLKPGPHELHLENRALGYDEIRQVIVKPGEVVTIQVAPPRSALTVRATEDARVWVDGVLAGDTPLVGSSVTLGTHEVIVKRGSDERRFVVTSTMKPAELSVDFSRPGP